MAGLHGSRTGTIGESMGESQCPPQKWPHLLGPPSPRSQLLVVLGSRLDCCLFLARFMAPDRRHSSERQVAVAFHTYTSLGEQPEVATLNPQPKKPSP